MTTVVGHSQCPCHRRRRRSLILACGSALLMAGCASYRPTPIDPAVLAEVWQDLDQRGATEQVRAAVAASAAPSAVTGFDLADGIDLVEAEAAALFFNPAIRATRLQSGVPAAEARHARLWEDPELGIDGEYLLADVDDPLVLGGSIGITIPLSGRRGAAARLAAARLAASELAVWGAEWALLSELRQAWLELAGRRARIALLERAETELARLVGLAPHFRAAQAVTVVDERLLRIQQLRVRDARLQAQARVARQRLAILALIGLHPAQEWRLRATWEELPTFAPVDAAQVLAETLDHPQLRQVMAAYQVAERQLALEVRKQYPDLRFGLGGGSDEGEAVVLFGLGLVPIPLWNANRAAIAGARAERAVAGVEIEAALQELTHRFAAAGQAHQVAAARLALLEQELAPLVDQQVTDARRLTGLGQLDLFLLADALEQARQVRLELLDARLALSAAALAQQTLVGPSIPMAVTGSAAGAAAP